VCCNGYIYNNHTRKRANTSRKLFENMNIEKLNQRLRDFDFEVVLDDGLDIYGNNGRQCGHIAFVKNEEEAVEVFEKLENVFDFSFFVEFETREEFENFIK
jgi:hypothetical protein